MQIAALLPVIYWTKLQPPLAMNKSVSLSFITLIYCLSFASRFLVSTQFGSGSSRRAESVQRSPFNGVRSTRSLGRRSIWSASRCIMKRSYRFGSHKWISTLDITRDIAEEGQVVLGEYYPASSSQLEILSGEVFGSASPCSRRGWSSRLDHSKNGRFKSWSWVAQNHFHFRFSLPASRCRFNGWSQCSKISSCTHLDPLLHELVVYDGAWSHNLWP